MYNVLIIVVLFVFSLFFVYIVRISYRKLPGPWWYQYFERVVSGIGIATLHLNFAFPQLEPNLVVTEELLVVYLKAAALGIPRKVIGVDLRSQIVEQLNTWFFELISTASDPSIYAWINQIINVNLLRQ